MKVEMNKSLIKSKSFIKSVEIILMQVSRCFSEEQTTENGKVNNEAKKRWSMSKFKELKFEKEKLRGIVKQNINLMALLFI